MRGSIHIQFVVACLFLSGSLLFAVVCFAGSGWGYRCITGAGNNTCNSSGNAMCAVLGQQNGVWCTYCTGAASLPPRYCVKWEWETVGACARVGTSDNACHGNPARKGTCMDGACVNTVLVGSCGSKQYVPCML